MNGPQDLGGAMGFGPVVPEPEDEIFHAQWEKTALALTLAAGALGRWNIDTSRHARESIPPARYLSFSYYQIWLTALEQLLRQAGLVTEAELREGRSLEPPRPVTPLKAADVGAVLARGTPYDRPAQAPARFVPGQPVRTINEHPPGHTRLPRYARDKQGVVERVHGVFVFPDSHAHGQGEAPQWLYTIRFEGREIWGQSADLGITLSVDAWESYLEPL
ncbi:nitrile hydratase subunit beta [Roseomonas marmotae]|uniref:Nitrile hydratase subunit beta n=1 Tax=Roseomonas marmotae TaxID=2768161 RepID=A0ABS3KED5_9PROT|nr:nitrile hydratase subunit beta [Roseomonas marmotae]MBO1075821.1 nitrile hydratase subunit beta [Roseomonas marmotae]QTI81985.1 nitrile hydratase subunit beta [Roseomonas marmotae]